MVTIFDFLFGCWHKRMSFPMTGGRQQYRSAAASQTGTYVVCLACGKEFGYDWQKMRVLSSARAEGPCPIRVEVEAS
jgi:hypothetical protein